MTIFEQKLIQLLKEDSRYTHETLAKMLNVPVSQITETVEKLENMGVIVKYTTIINTEKTGEEYIDAVPVFRLLSINYFISGTFRIVSGNLLVTQRRLKFNLLIAIVSTVTNIIADYFFIQWWGSMGAAYATVLVVVISSVMSTVRLIISFKKAGSSVAKISDIKNERK